MLKTVNREFFHKQPISTKYFASLRCTPPPHPKMLLFRLVIVHTSFMDMSMMGLADLLNLRSEGRLCTPEWLKQAVLFVGIVYQTDEFLFLEVPQFSFKDQFPLKSTHLHLKPHREEIKVSTEILIKRYQLFKTDKMSINDHYVTQNSSCHFQENVKLGAWLLVFLPGFPFHSLKECEYFGWTEWDKVQGQIVKRGVSSQVLWTSFGLYFLSSTQVPGGLLAKYPVGKVINILSAHICELKYF